MLKTKNLVTVKPDKDSASKELLTKEYEQLWFQYDESDPVETFSKTSDKADVMVDGKKWEGTRPVNAYTLVTSDEKIAEMLNQTLQFLISDDPTHKDADGADVPNNMWLLLLDHAAYGYDFRKRNAMQQKLRPKAPLTTAEAWDNIYKSLIRSGKTEKQAKKLADLMMAAQEDDAEETVQNPVETVQTA